MAKGTQGWLAAQHNLLLQLKNQGVSWDVICSHFPERSYRAVRSKWDRMNGLQANGRRRVPQMITTATNHDASQDVHDVEDENEVDCEGDADKHAEKIQVDADTEQQNDIGAAFVPSVDEDIIAADNQAIIIGDTSSTDPNSSSKHVGNSSNAVGAMEIEGVLPAEVQAIYADQIAMMDTVEAEARAGIRAEIRSQARIDQILEHVGQTLGILLPPGSQVMPGTNKLRSSDLPQTMVTAPEKSPSLQNADVAANGNSQDDTARNVDVAAGVQLIRQRMQKNANRVAQGQEAEQGYEHEPRMVMDSRSDYANQLARRFDAGQRAGDFIDPQVLHLFPVNPGSIQVEHHQELVETFGASVVAQSAARATAKWTPTAANSGSDHVEGSFVTPLTDAEVGRLQTVVRQSSDYHGVLGYWQMLVLQDFPRYSAWQLENTYSQLRERNPALPWNSLPWFPAEDSFLINNVEKHRQGWKMIGDAIRRSPYQCEDRYRFLEMQRGIDVGPPLELLDLTPMFINEEMLE